MAVAVHGKLPCNLCFHDGCGNANGGFFADAAGVTIVAELKGYGGLGIGQRASGTANYRVICVFRSK